MKGTILSIFFLAAFALKSFAEPAEKNCDAKKNYNQSIAKIEVTAQEYSYYMPWQFPYQTHGWGTGFVIDPHHIVTNAHVIQSSAFITVKLAGEQHNYPATLEIIDRDCDLALIKVADKEFAKKAIPLPLAKECFVGLDIFTVGFPKGGEELCLSKGAITREEMRYPVGANIPILMAEIDAFINFGSSGSPVFTNEGTVVGVVSELNQETRIGSMVALPVLQHFLEESQKNKYQGFPYFTLDTEKATNPHLRAYYQLSEKTDEGILVVKILPGSLAENYLLPGDIIVDIDRHKILNDGTFEYIHKEKLKATHLIRQHFYGETVTVSVKRKGKLVSIEIPLVKKENSENKIVSHLAYAAAPKYLVLGGFVFQPLTWNYLYSWGAEWEKNAPLDLRYLCAFGQKTKEHKEIVLLTRILPSELSIGYESQIEAVVTSFNEKKVLSLAHLAELIDSCKDEYFKIQLKRGADFLNIVLNRKKVLENHEKILKTYQIPAARSKDLL